jgi:acetyl esterase
MLDQGLKVLLKLTHNTSYSKLDEFSIDTVRQNVKTLAKMTSLPSVPVQEVNDAVISGGAAKEDKLTVRIYKPFSSGTPLPAMVYFHGGGFVLYDIDDYDGFCRFLSIACNIIVVAVNYRRAPEFPFPRSHNDAAASVEWVFNNAAVLNIDSKLIMAGGDSAGGNLALHAAMTSYKKGNPVFLQLLIYPLLGFNVSTNSFKEYGSGYFLNKNTIDWFLTLLDDNPGAAISDPRLNPEKLKDASLAIMPPTILAIAEHDVLRDQAFAFSKRLFTHTLKCDLLYFEDLPHNFVLLSGKNKASKKAVSEIASKITQQLYDSSGHSSQR